MKSNPALHFCFASGEWLDYRGYKMIATYHPAYLLRNPAAKGDVWKDLQKVMAELGLEIKKNKAK